MSLRREEQVGRDYVSRLKITPTALERSVEYLSGGNQQKVVIARWLFSQARLLIFDEPTRGIDVGAKIDVYHVINELTSQGISILLISSDFPELLAMSDRVAVVRDGRILHIAEGRRLTEYQLTSIASGAEIGSLAYRSLTLRDVALPLLHQLRDKTGHTVHLAVLDEKEMRVLYLEKLAGPVASEMMSRTGATAPASCTGVGKVLLAYERPEEVQAWIEEHGLPYFTENTITNPMALMTELGRIREQGYGLDLEEHEIGITCVAAPVVDDQGTVVAAISVSGAADALPADLGNSDLRRAVVTTAHAIGAAIGRETFASPAASA
jgi:DNA-binding IclR family transcriptional regulator